MRIKGILTLFLIVTMLFTQAQDSRTGVMILAHGGTHQWNEMVQESTRSIAKKYPTEIAFGMALPRTMQEAIDKLESQGVEEIVVVPLFISSHSFIIRQSEYLLGLRAELADPPIVMDHSMDAADPSPHNATSMNHHSGGMDHGAHNMANHGGSPAHGNGNMNHQGGGVHTSHDMAGPTTLDRLKLKAKVSFTKPLDDHPIVAEIISKRISELSKNPSNEMVILVGHGPNPEDDNKNWVRDMESIADQVRDLQKKSGKVSKMILSVTVRDDADPDIYNQAKENLRNLVTQGSKQGDVLVVPVFLSSGGAELKVKTRLEGLEYKWSGKTLLPDPKITEFISLSVTNALKGS